MSSAYLTRQFGGTVRLWSEKPQFDEDSFAWRQTYAFGGEFINMTDAEAAALFPDACLPQECGPESIIEIQCSYGR